MYSRANLGIFNRSFHKNQIVKKWKEWGIAAEAMGLLWGQFCFSTTGKGRERPRKSIRGRRGVQWEQGGQINVNNDNNDCGLGAVVAQPWLSPGSALVSYLLSTWGPPTFPSPSSRLSAGLSWGWPSNPSPGPVLAGWRERSAEEALAEAGVSWPLAGVRDGDCSCSWSRDRCGGEWRLH